MWNITIWNFILIVCALVLQQRSATWYHGLKSGWKPVGFYENRRNRLGPVSPVFSKPASEFEILKNFEIKILKKTICDFKIFGQNRIQVIEMTWSIKFVDVHNVKIVRFSQKTLGFVPFCPHAAGNELFFTWIKEPCDCVWGAKIIWPPHVLNSRPHIWCLVEITTKVLNAMC
jgi:hypothetical protein